MKTMIVCDVDGTLTDGSVYVDGNGNESLRFSKRDGWLLTEARAAGIEAVVVTDDPNAGPARERARKLGLEFFPCAAPADLGGEVSAASVVRCGRRAGSSTSTWTRERARKLGLEFFPCAAPADLGGEVSAAKAGVVKRYKAEGFRVVYIGDSPADLEAMREADEAWAPADGGAVPEGTRHTEGEHGGLVYHTEDGLRVHITSALGGHGVLHEVLGYLLARAK